MVVAMHVRACPSHPCHAPPPPARRLLVHGGVGPQKVRHVRDVHAHLDVAVGQRPAQGGAGRGRKGVGWGVEGSTGGPLEQGTARRPWQEVPWPARGIAHGAARHGTAKRCMVQRAQHVMCVQPRPLRPRPDVQRVPLCPGHRVRPGRCRLYGRNVAAGGAGGLSGSIAPTTLKSTPVFPPMLPTPQDPAPRSLA